MAPHGLRALRRPRLGVAGRFAAAPASRCSRSRSVAGRATPFDLDGAGDQSIAGAWHGDTLAGVMLADGKPSGRRIRLVRRATPFVVEKNYPLWPARCPTRSTPSPKTPLSS